VPGAQLTASTPALHALPAAQGPLQAAVASPVAAPLAPAGHGKDVAVVEPSGQ
jgi:hypothetical protein